MIVDHPPVVIIGSGGHAKVLIDALLLGKIPVLAALDSNPDFMGKKVLGVPVVGEHDCVHKYSPKSVLLVNGIGSVKFTKKRSDIYTWFKEMGYGFAKVIHPSAQIAQDVCLGEGVQVMAGAVIQVGSQIGENSIINTCVSVDHDCKIGPHVHLAPGVVLSGGVSIERGTHVGTGACVIQNVIIGEDALIGAGALIVKDVERGSKIRGHLGQNC